MNSYNSSTEGGGEVEPQPPVPFGTNEAVKAAPVNPVPNLLGSPLKPKISGAKRPIETSTNCASPNEILENIAPGYHKTFESGVTFNNNHNNHINNINNDEGEEVPHDAVITLEGWVEIHHPKRMGLSKVDTREGSSSPFTKRHSQETKWKMRYFKLVGSQLVYYKNNRSAAANDELEIEHYHTPALSHQSSTDTLNSERKHFQKLRTFIHKRRHSTELNDSASVNPNNISSAILRSGAEDDKEIKKEKKLRIGYVQLQGCRVDPAFVGFTTHTSVNVQPFYTATTTIHSSGEITTDTISQSEGVSLHNINNTIPLEEGNVLEIIHPLKHHIFFVAGAHQKEKILRSRSSICRLKFADKPSMDRWLTALRSASQLNTHYDSTPVRAPASPAFQRNASNASIDQLNGGEEFSKYNSYTYVSDATLELLSDSSVMHGGVLRIRTGRASRVAFFILEDGGKMRWYSIPVKSHKNQIGVFKLKSWDMTINKKALSFKLTNNTTKDKNIMRAKNEAKTLFGNEDTFLFRAKDDESFDKWVQCIGTFTRIVPGQAPELEDDASVNMWDNPSGHSETCNWFNLIMARNFQDMQNSTAFFNHVQEKLQKKLDTAGRPEWVGPIKIVDLNIGTESPTFKNVTMLQSEIPNELKGETDLEYRGGFSFTITSSITISIGKTFNLPISVKVTLPRLIGKLYIYISPILHEPCTAFFAEPPIIEFETHVELNDTVFANKVPRFTEFLVTTLKRAFFDRTVYPNKMIFNLPFPGRKMRFSSIKTGKPSKYPRREMMDVGLFTKEYALLCKDVLHRTADMWTFGAFTSIHDLFHEEAQLHGLTGNDSEIVGKEMIKVKLREFRRSFIGNAKMVSSGIVVNNDFACCKMTIQGLMGQKFETFRPSSHTNEVFMEATSVVKIRGLKIQEWWLSWTPATIIQYTVNVDVDSDEKKKKK